MNRTYIPLASGVLFLAATSGLAGALAGASQGANLPAAGLGVGLPATENQPPAMSLASTQTAPLDARRTRLVASRIPARPKKDGPADIFSGVNFSDDQKAQIDHIHQSMKSKMDAVSHDAGSADWQKTAMIEGLQRMERRQIFQLLTPDQQAEVRGKVLAERAAEQKARQDGKQT